MSIEEILRDAWTYKDATNSRPNGVETCPTANLLEPLLKAANLFDYRGRLLRATSSPGAEPVATSRTRSDRFVGLLAERRKLCVQEEPRRCALRPPLSLW